MLRGCCGVKRFESCILDSVNKECGTVAHKFVDDYLTKTVRETGNLVCASIDEALCTSLKPIKNSSETVSAENDRPENVYEAVHYFMMQMQRKP